MTSEATITPALGDSRVKAGYVDAVEPAQRRSSRWEVSSRLIEQPRPQRLGHAGAAVVGGAAAHADDEPPAAGIERRPDELPRPVGARPAGVALLAAEEDQARRGGHLDHRRRPFVQQSPDSRDRTPQRVLHLRRLLMSRRRRQYRLHDARAAVGHRHNVYLCLGQGAAQTGGDSLGGLLGGEAALELLGTHEDSHLLSIPFLIRRRNHSLRSS